MMSLLSNQEIKTIRSLAEKKYRDRTGLFVVEGEKMVEEAIRSGFGIEAVWRRDEIGEKAMSRISLLSTPSPVLAVVRKPVVPSAAELFPCAGLSLALDAIRDPGNLGTILRTADWFGVRRVAAAPGTVDLFNPTVIQATMGAVFRISFVYTDIPDLCRTCAAAGGRVYGTFLSGQDLYATHLETDPGRSVVVVVGNESNGISAEVARQVTDRITIPPVPAAGGAGESLNAAAATAITLAEFRRQARQPSNRIEP